MTCVHVVSYGGELSVKARGTRNRFSERLARNLADALEGAGLEHSIRRTWSRIYVESPSARVAEVAARVFGVNDVPITLILLIRCRSSPAANRCMSATYCDITMNWRRSCTPATGSTPMAVFISRTSRHEQRGQGEITVE